MQSDRIKLIPCDSMLINIILEGDPALSDYLKVQVPHQWTEFGTEMFDYSLKMIESDKRNLEWGAYLVILVPNNILVGTCGYKGFPDDKNCVEIGYEITASYRNQGLATELTKMLVSKALNSDIVSGVIAHTLAEKNASTRVLEKNAFVFEAELEDEENGLIWKWGNYKKY